MQIPLRTRSSSLTSLLIYTVLFSILQIADEGERFPLKILIVPLTYAEAEPLAQTLTNVFQEEGEGGEEGKGQRGRLGGDAEQAKAAASQMKADGTGYEVLQGRIKIIADTNSNSLVLKASEANLVFLQEIIKELDIAPNVKNRDTYFPP